MVLTPLFSFSTRKVDHMNEVSRSMYTWLPCRSQNIIRAKIVQIRNTLELELIVLGGVGGQDMEG